jgi:hypothetical protein
MESAKIEKCLVCGKDAHKCFNETILHKYNISYYKCDYCGFLFTEKPYWLNEAYESAINNSDTGVCVRNFLLQKFILALFRLFFSKKNKFVDYAGGYGLFTRLMRDKGYNYFWQDNYCQNLFAIGFEYNQELKYDALTAFEVFEHFTDPMSELKKIIGLADTIIFTTNLMRTECPNLKDWWYYGLDHGQHISFYTKKTLEYIANSNLLNLYTNGKSIHILSKRKFPKFVFKFLFLRQNLIQRVYQKRVFRASTDALYIIKNNI